MTASRTDEARRPSDGTERVYVALGSNLGDRAAWLGHARTRLAGTDDCTVVRATRVEETEPIGPAGQGPYLNQMLLLHTRRSPLALLDLLQRVEAEAGRERAERWGPRTLDCDVVMFGMRTIRHPRLVVPHPEIGSRAFWQDELRELGAVLAPQAGELSTGSDA